MAETNSICSERRVSQREPAIHNDVLLDFTAHKPRQAFKGSILNVSESGALVNVGRLPLLDERRWSRSTIWLRLRSPVQTRWVSARAVRFGKENEVGLEFTDPMRYDLIIASTLGIDAGNLPVNPPSSESVTVIAE